MNQYNTLKKIYNQSGYASYSDEIDKNEMHIYYLHKMTEYLLNKFTSVPVDGAFLEIGCGKGFFLKSFIDKGFDAYGIDLSQYVLTTINNKIRKHVACSYAETLPFKNDKFKLILLHHVIEHVIGIDMLLSEFQRVLTKNALIVIVTTTLPFGSANHWRKFGIFSDRTHVSLFAKNYWLNVFRRYNFEFLENIQHIVWLDPPNYFGGRSIYNYGLIGRFMARILSRIVRGSFLFRFIK